MRLIDGESVIPLTTTTFPTPTTAQTQLHTALTPDKSLFAIERQNLYRDGAREARQWCRVLCRTDVNACPSALLARLEALALEGLDALIVEAGRQGRDGPLGWTAKPEVFCLGVRVVCAAEVVLEWRTKSRRVGTRGSVVRMKLQQLVDVGGRTGLHPVWMEQAQQILNKSAQARVERIARVLQGLPLTLG